MLTELGQPLHWRTSNNSRPGWIFSTETQSRLLPLPLLLRCVGLGPLQRLCSAFGSGHLPERGHPGGWGPGEREHRALDTAHLAILSVI